MSGGFLYAADRRNEYLKAVHVLAGAASMNALVILRDFGIKTLMTGPKAALTSLLQEVSTYDPNPSNWSDTRKEFWNVEANVLTLEQVATFVQDWRSGQSASAA